MSNLDIITKAGFSQAVYECEKLLFSLSYAILQDRQACADAVQAALLKAWKNRHALKKQSAFQSWLARIVINESKNMLRTHQNVELREDLAAEIPDNQQAIDIRNAVYNLPTKYRLPVVLYYFEGYSTEEMANILHIAINTVCSRLYRARNLLRKELPEYEVNA